MKKKIIPVVFFAETWWDYSDILCSLRGMSPKKDMFLKEGEHFSIFCTTDIEKCVRCWGRQLVLLDYSFGTTDSMKVLIKRMRAKNPALLVGWYASEPAPTTINFDVEIKKNKKDRKALKEAIRKFFTD